MNGGLRTKIFFLAAGIFASGYLIFLIVYPFIIVPQIGTPNFNVLDWFQFMLAPLLVVLIITGMTVGSFREFVILAIAAGSFLKISEFVMATHIPYVPQTSFTDPIKHWTLDLFVAIVFSALIFLIGLPFGWLWRRFREMRPE